LASRTSWEVTVLKFFLSAYILFGLAIAGLNYGWASRSSQEAQQVILRIWQIYENQFKTALIVVCSLLTLRLVRSKESPRLRRYNFVGFLCAAAVVHIAAPLVSGNPDFYFFAMPLPWSTMGLRLAVGASRFRQEYMLHWGMRGLMTALAFFAAVHVIVFAGTLLLGRRWQCSTLCLFNGFASEVFAPAFPLLGKRKRLSRRTLGFFAVLRWLVLGSSLAFVVFWLSILALEAEAPATALMERIETYKYLAIELLPAMFFWVVLVGRGYCYYCPLGTVLGWLARAAGQKIITTKSECIDCGKCDRVCPMSISINEKARRKEAVVDSRCVGCGHCVDACPSHTLAYSTRFLQRIGRG
jgi:ferredoxin